MTLPPDFDDLVGRDVERDERERLRHVHELLLEAGPPPELPPHLEAGPTLAMTLGGRARHHVRRRVLLLAATLVALVVAFLAGYVTGNDGGGVAAARVLKLAGTKAAPSALAALRIEPADAAGNWPMKLSVTGLPTLPANGYYEVYLMRDGKPYAPCGTFVVAAQPAGVLVTLNAPYRLEPGDTWVVTRHLPGQDGAGTVVLRPLA